MGKQGGDWQVLQVWCFAYKEVVSTYMRLDYHHSEDVVRYMLGAALCTAYVHVFTASIVAEWKYLLVD